MTLGCWSLSRNRSTSRSAMEKQSGSTRFTATARPSKQPLMMFSPVIKLSECLQSITSYKNHFANILKVLQDWGLSTFKANKHVISPHQPEDKGAITALPKQLLWIKNYLSHTDGAVVKLFCHGCDSARWTWASWAMGTLPPWRHFFTEPSIFFCL